MAVLNFGLMTSQTGDACPAEARRATQPLQVVQFHELEALRPWVEQWDRLARGVPFRTWAWQSAWWRHYGGAERHRPGDAPLSDKPGRGAPSSFITSADLWVLGVFEPSGDLVGLLPLYRQATRRLGRVLRFLGSGEVCSEYLSMLCEPQWETPVADALAAWLAEANTAAEKNRRLRWDILELSAVEAQDHAVVRLVRRLRRLGHAVHCRPGPPCWRITLPQTWEDFLAPLSRNRRRKLRSLERKFAEGHVRARCIQTYEEIAPAIDLLIEFQHARRRQLGQATCFDSARYLGFLHEAALRLQEAGRLALIVVEQGGTPLTVELAFRGGERLYAYQAGINGQRLSESPGHLGHYALVRHVLDHGLSVLDFLRGDEPYKAGWEARPYATCEFRVAARRTSAWLRHIAWRAGAAAKAWLRRRFNRVP